MDKWRFIDSGLTCPYYNMGLDRALFEAFLSDKTMPVFRFYRWRNPALSLGRFQNPKKVLDFNNCRKDNLAVLKRITGGTAIYHWQNELTYSLTCPVASIGSLSVKESYRKITSFLVAAYRRLGLEAQYAKDSALAAPFKIGRPADFCFAGCQEYDILIQGKKIGGNAQKRKKGVIFQHGSIPFKLPKNPGKYLLNKNCGSKKYLSLSELGVTDFYQFKNILINSFENNLGVKLISGKINKLEEELAAKYSKQLMQFFKKNEYTTALA
ncbi:MAG: lipoate--protein ligase family protein [Candidatus Omnitrophica bacterium]|nr:lipoate--protein ligase family protein [Candidatus Omnitrophota bacterium]MCF7876775.1 lipoate--protein ligase family protein [Candidatus Omnitrophota bacterium]MCF7878221.1 lipoate--protein ligase family protein [Candidatus Omnitrophota bacterium]